jgi:hypothetical protein
MLPSSSVYFVVIKRNRITGSVTEGGQFLTRFFAEIEATIIRFTRFGIVQVEVVRRSDY